MNSNDLLNIEKEKSCGAVIYMVIEKDLYFLLIKQILGHISFPKGHTQKNESEMETAIREIKEETNIDVELDIDFRLVNTYSPKEGVLKDVVLFVGRAKNDDLVPQNGEVDSIMWCKYEDAKKILTYKNDIDILDKAYEYILVKRLF